MYFTVLERFTEQELLQQIVDLSNLERELLIDTKAKSRRRTLRNQKYRIENRLIELRVKKENEKMVYGNDKRADGNINHIDNPITEEVESQNHHKNKNNDQNQSQNQNQNRHLEILPTVSDTLPDMSTAADPAAVLIGVNDSSSGSSADIGSSSSDSRSIDCNSSSSTGIDCVDTTLTNHCNTDLTKTENKDRINFEETLNLNPSIPNLITPPTLTNTDIPSNPKTRLGWGFWKS